MCILYIAVSIPYTFLNCDVSLNCLLSSMIYQQLYMKQYRPFLPEDLTENWIVFLSTVRILCQFTLPQVNMTGTKLTELTNII